MPVGDVVDAGWGRPWKSAAARCWLRKLLVGNPEIRERILAVGLPKAEIAALPRAVAAAREAQSAWIVMRDRSKDDAQRARENDGMTMRANLVASARWNLRDDRVAQATLDAIQEGEGVEDLVQDLFDVAALIEQRADLFEADLLAPGGMRV